MADDLQDLGSLSMFPFDPNWATSPATSVDLNRQLMEHPGTVSDLNFLSDDQAWTWDAEYMLDGPQDFYDLIDFFNTHRGKAKKFWVQHPIRIGILESDSLGGATMIPLEPNKVDIAWQGYERIYIVMSNGDLITRKVSSVDYSVSLDRVELNLDTATDRNITSVNHLIIGRLVLARLEEDIMRVRCETTDVGKVSLTFKEVPMEYSDV